MPPTASAPARPASRSSGRRPIPACARLSMRLSQLGELGLLAELEQRGLILGVEHDAAQLGDGLVVTQDVLVEGIHFRLDWLTWRELGFRAAAVNLSDLAASGATPEALLVTFAAPASTALARRSASTRVAGLRGTPTRCSTSLTGSPSMPRTSRAAPTFVASSISTSCRLPTERRSATSASARTSSYLRRSRVPTAFRSSGASRKVMA